MHKNHLSRRMLSLLLTALLILTLFPVRAAAEQAVTVYVTVSDRGTLAVGKDARKTVMANVPVTVTDSDGDGKTTVDEVMRSAHSTYCPDGYATAATTYGTSVTKLWGVTTTNTLFFVNGSSLSTGVGADQVSDGDHVTASVNKDSTYYADWYSGFDASSKTVAAGESFDLTLKGHLGMAYTPEEKTDAALSGISIGTASSSGFTALEGRTTDENGKVTLAFDNAGTYIVSANGTVTTTASDWSQAPYDGSVKVPVNAPVIAPVCVVTVKAPLTLKVTDSTEGNPEAVEYTYTLNDTPVQLTVNATEDEAYAGGSYAYEWRYKTSPTAAEYKKGGSNSKINSVTYKSIATSTDSLRYYYCHVTYTVGEKTYEFDSPLVKVSVIASKAAVPTIKTQPADAAYLVGGETSALSAASSVSDGGSLSYQWYSSRDNGAFAAVDGATGSTLVPSENTPCTVSYYCRVTNTLESVSGTTYTASIKTNTAAITFQSAAEYGANWKGTGSKSDPYLLADAADLASLSTLCNTNSLSFSGKYFKMTADITLPDAWTPVGTSSTRFSGSFDGGGHLLTVPENSKPLFGYVRGAEVKNLNIYGTKIAGYGLVDNYTVDSGISKTIDITNCTLKSGSSTLYSGFIGGYASGTNQVVITNCTVEKNVVIGYDGTQSSIGAFAGEFNGCVTGCTSAATVKGVNFVGGLVGNKGQSMGECEINDCVFSGSVEAAGNYAGGILGAGYGGAGWGFTANAPWPSVKNCISSGTVNGGNYVGGILGAEPGTVQVWANGVGYIQNNLFSGTISASAENAIAGGVIGYIRAINRYAVVSNNYCVSGCGAEKAIGKIEYVENAASDGTKIGSGWCTATMNNALYGRDDDPAGTGADALAKFCTAASLLDGTTVRTLNAGLNSSGDWVQTEAGPAFGGKRHIVRMTITPALSSNKCTATVGEEDPLAGKKLALTYSDGTSETVDISLAVRSYTVSNALGGKSIAASIVYNHHQFVFQLTVKAGVETPAPPSSADITVNFSLMGDSVHGEGGTVHTLKSGNLTTWIAPVSITVPANSKVMTVFAKALNQYGYSWVNEDEAGSTAGNYIQSVTTSSGVTLAEFANGVHSGWMYTLNGSYPLSGVKEQPVSNGDSIVFHYTDDYTVEKASENWSGAAAATITPPCAISEKIAAATVTDAQAAEALSAANGTVTVIPQNTDGADTVSVTLSTASAKKIAASASLAVETSGGAVTIPGKTLAAMVSKASGSTLTVSVTKKSISDVPDKTIVTDADTVVAEITVTSGGKNITSFDGNPLSVDIPVAGRYVEGQSCRVVVLSGDGGKDVLSGKCVKRNGKLFVETAITHLSTFIVLRQTAFPFTDVSDGAWYADAVSYVYINGLFHGTSATAFSPNSAMTRAMFISVLYRMAGSPAITGTSSFADVPAGAWYSNAVIWAVQNGIVAGRTAAAFAPRSSVTREQIAAILYRYAQYRKYDTAAPSGITGYTDAGQISSYAVPAMIWAVHSGLISGTTSVTLVPRGTATRAQVAAILMRFAGNTAK